MSVSNIFKYVLQGLAVGAAVYLLARHTISLKEIVMIALVVAITFFILDYFTPSVGDGARLGTGLGLGFEAVGFPTGSTAGVGAGLTSAGVGLADAAGTAADTVGSAMSTAGSAVSGALAPLIQLGGADDGTLAMPIIKPGCHVGSPLFADSSDTLAEGIKGCDCSLTCKGCGPELQCPVNCSIGQVVFPDCRIASNNSPYKIVPGQYSHQVVLPGYNECVKPYNFFSSAY